jgi:hypothetical protein
VIGCEGWGDAEFIRQLCQSRGITEFQIEHLTAHEKGEASGSGGFQRYLRGIPLRSGSLRAILLVSDYDDKPEKSFKAIQRQIKKANLVPPLAPGEIGRGKGLVPVCVLMIPHGHGLTKGCIESVLLEAAASHNGSLVPCVEKYMQCLQMNFSASQTAKVKFRCLLAVTHPKDPNISVAIAVKPSINLIPLGHACFNGIADFLTEFKGRV